MTDFYFGLASPMQEHPGKTERRSVVGACVIQHPHSSWALCTRVVLQRPLGEQLEIDPGAHRKSGSEKWLLKSIGKDGLLIDNHC